MATDPQPDQEQTDVADLFRSVQEPFKEKVDTYMADPGQLDAILAAFLTYAVGFVARPIGGVVFGHFGDKYGRKKLLQLAIILVGAATFLMGCLPTFDQIGYWAVALLIFLRFVQGFAVGGEWGGGVLLVAEHSPDKTRGFWASFPQAAVPIGNLIATIVLLVLSSTLSQEAFLAWGWRIGFWLSIVIVAIGYYVRTRITDAKIFVDAQKEVEQQEQVRYGVLEVLKRYPRGVITAMGLRFAENIMYYLVVTFSIGDPRAADPHLGVQGTGLPFDEARVWEALEAQGEDDASEAPAPESPATPAPDSTDAPEASEPSEPAGEHTVPETVETGSGQAWWLAALGALGAGGLVAARRRFGLTR